MLFSRNTIELEKYCKKVYKDAESVIHRWGHISRVADGARWIVKINYGTSEEQELAYTAGLLHDIVRPITEKKCHAESSADEAGSILKDFKFKGSSMSKICKAIKDHRSPPSRWDSIFHQSVYLADKVFEHMGAYLDFRACVWAGELSHEDYKGLSPTEAVLNYYEKASSKFLDRNFPGFIKPIVSYQKRWNERFFKNLRNKKGWAEEMAERLFYKGKEKKDFDETLRRFEPKFNEQNRWKDEMISYIDSDLDSSIFNMIINKPNSGAEF